MTSSVRRLPLNSSSIRSAYSAIGAVAAVVAVWARSLSVTQVLLRRGAAIGGGGPPPLPWPRDTWAGSGQSGPGAGAFALTAVSACLVDHPLVVRWRTRRARSGQGPGQAAGGRHNGPSPALQGQRSAVSASGWLVVGGVLAACSKAPAPKRRSVGCGIGRPGGAVECLLGPPAAICLAWGAERAGVLPAWQPGATGVEGRPPDQAAGRDPGRGMRKEHR
jgi:hypothetical protein